MISTGRPTPGQLSEADIAHIRASLENERASMARASTEPQPENFEPRHRREHRSLGQIALNALKATGRGLAWITGVTAAREAYKNHQARDRAEILAKAAVYIHRVDVVLATPAKTFAMTSAARPAPAQRGASEPTTWQHEGSFGTADSEFLSGLGARLEDALRARDERAAASVDDPTGEYATVSR